MKLRVLALDYDGTIAREGALDPEVRAAIERARAGGLVVVLVTGRILSDLRVKLGDVRLFDAVVAENGAVAAFPQAGRSTTLAPCSSRELLDELRRRGVEARRGECVVELPAAGGPTALAIVRERELPLTLHFNRDRLMVLPQAVSKATGLREALRSLRLSVHNTVGIGDAENDHELLSVCEIGAAVAWGSLALRSVADVIVPGEDPRAVAAYIDAIAGQTRIILPPRARRQLVLGRNHEGGVVSLAVRGRNVLIAGDPRSGKSWIAGLLCEQLILAGYSVCLIDPEGDYSVLEALPGVVLLGGDDPPPTMHQVARTLRHSDVSMIIDLSHMPRPEKEDYVLRMLRVLTGLRRETGLPHRIVVDEAHYFLHDEEQAGVLDFELAGYTLITYRVSGLRPEIMAATECVIVTQETDPAEARLLHEAFRGREGLEHWQRTLRELELDEAALLPVSEEAGGALTRFRIAPRLTHHVRHRTKYLDVPVDAGVAFRFVQDDGTPGPVAGSLQELVDVLIGLPEERIEGHIRRNDFSRWIRDTFRDPSLAERIQEFEERHSIGQLPDFNGAVIHAVQERYRVAGHLV